MKKQHTTKQHFVSKFLLKLFSYDGKHVYVLDRKQNNKIYKKNIDNFCYENDIYDEKWVDTIEQLGKYVLDNKIEDYFADLEDKIAPVLKEVNKKAANGERNIRLSEDNLHLLFEFMATLYLRNPYIFKGILDYYNGVENEPEVDAVLQATEYLFDIFKWGSPKALLAFSKKIGIISNDITGSPYNVVYERISNMKYVFWYSERGDFVTSSFPLHIMAADGEHAERIMMPVSDKLVVVLFDPLPFPYAEGIVIDMDSNILNWNMALYFKSYSKEMAHFFIAKNEESLKRLL